MWRYSFSARHRLTSAAATATGTAHGVFCSACALTSSTTVNHVNVSALARSVTNATTTSTNHALTTSAVTGAVGFANVISRRSAHSSHTAKPAYSTLTGDEALRSEFEASDLMAEGESAVAGDENDGGRSGLQFTPDTQEMTADEIRACVERSAAWYSPSIYAWVAFASVDVLEVMMLHRAIPTDRTGKLISRWFADPSLCLQQPRSLPDLLGTARWAVISPGLQELLSDYERVSPLVTTLREHNLPVALWAPLMRWVAALATLNHATQTTNIPGLVLGLANGHAPPQLGLPSGAARAECGPIVARVVMAAGAELGVLPLSLLGVSLLHLHGGKCRFRDQRLLMVASARAAARRLDWSVRTSGTIEHAAPKWLQAYLPSAIAQAAGGSAAEAAAAAAIGTVDAAVVSRQAEGTTTTSRKEDPAQQPESTEDLQLEEAEALLESFNNGVGSNSRGGSSNAASRNDYDEDDGSMVDASVADMGAESEGEGDEQEATPKAKARMRSDGTTIGAAETDDGDLDPFAPHRDEDNHTSGNLDDVEAAALMDSETAQGGEAASVASYFAPAERRSVMADEATRDVARASRRAALMQHLQS